MILAHTTSADATKAVAAAMAALVVAGDLFVLAGDLGAGKTAFVQGFGEGLGVVDRITSPTFTLANRYDGRLEVNHLDVYRLDQLDEIKELGIYELIDGDAVTLIEWGDAIAPALGADYCEIRFEFGEGDNDRDLAVQLMGQGWVARTRAVTEALSAWSRGDEQC
jgi:tRNA threonylcarbamoyladenosine biosynthesis protein TsaE